MVVDRDAELSIMDNAVRDALSGNGSVLVISGSRGSGKTALLGELSRVAHALGARVLRARGAELESVFPFGIVHQLLEPVLATVPSDIPELVSLLEKLCAERAMVILVDELCWIDVESIQVLAEVTRRLDGLRLVVAGTAGTDGYQADQVRERGVSTPCYRLRPASLTLPGTTALVGVHFGQTEADCDERFVAACHDLTGGNPALLTTLLAGLAASGLRPVARDAGRVGELGPALLLGTRMAWLGEEDEAVRYFAWAMVVLGAQAEPALVGQLAGLDEAGRTDALVALDGLGLVADGQLIDVTVERAVEASIPVRQHDKLRWEAAWVLHSDGHPAELVADQLVMVSSVLDRWALDVLREGAAACLRRGAANIATRYLRRALQDASGDPALRARLLVDLGVSERGFDPASSARHLCQAIPLLETVTDRAAAAVMISPAAIRSRPPVAKVVREIADALGDAEETPGPQREFALRLAARRAYLGVEDPRALAASVSVLRGFGRDLPLATAGERELAVMRLHAAMLTGDVPAHEIAWLGHRILDREPASFVHVHTALPLLVTVQVAADSAQDVAGWLDSGLAQARRQHAVAAEALIHAERTHVYLASGQMPQARASALRACELADAGWPETASQATIALALVAIETGDPDLATMVFDAKPDETDLAVSAVLRMLRGVVASARGDLVDALEHFLGCGRQLEQAGWHNPAAHRWRAWAATVQHRLGKVGAATEVSEEDHELAARWGAPAALGRALRIRGSVTAGKAGIELLRESADVFSGSGDRLGMARTFIVLGRRLIAEDGPDGPKFLWQGQELATACGASWLATEPGPEPAGAELGLGARTALTRTENRVAGWVVRNLTNQEIAEKLGVSRRAVEKHLTNSYRKLGVDGRAGLAEALATRQSEVKR
jgi:DNA-binding CsgD family transcriptional regulator